VLTEATGYLEHLGATEAAVLEVVLGWADNGYQVASVAAALDAVVAATTRRPRPLSCGSPSRWSPRTDPPTTSPRRRTSPAGHR
jgi:hypothetical protein